MPDPDRLSAATLARAWPADPPGYDRTRAPTIVHLGVGAFARAHLACYADELLRAGWPAMVRGVSLRSQRAEEELAPQDGLFTVLEREPDRDALAQVIGSLASVTTGPSAATDAIADPTTAMVTVTVTEKGYELHDDDLEASHTPSSAPAVIARGLLARPGDGEPPVIVALDNLLDNGRVLREQVRSVVAAVAPRRLGWFDDAVSFPSSVVDRIVPATTPQDLGDVAALLGLSDRAAVTAEHHRSWVIEDAVGLPPLGEVGVTVVDDIAPWQRQKLWLLNGPHSALAYAGLLAGVDTIAAAAAHPAVAPFVDRYVKQVLEVADLPPELESEAFVRRTLRRFRNPALRHGCQQVGADGSRKLGQRLLPVWRRRADLGLATDTMAIVAALWVVAAAGLPVQGQPLAPVDDPKSPELRGPGDRGSVLELCVAALGADLAPELCLQVTKRIDDICHHGLGALARPA